ncbi:unnamed protein product [Victoria cruziana]
MVARGRMDDAVGKKYIKSVGGGRRSCWGNRGIWWWPARGEGTDRRSGCSRESFAMHRDRLSACIEKGLSKLSYATYLHRIRGQVKVKRGAIRILEESETACVDRAHVCGSSNGLPQLQDVQSSFQKAPTEEKFTKGKVT